MPISSKPSQLFLRNANLDAISLGEVVEEPELSMQELQKLNEKDPKDSECGSPGLKSLFKNSDELKNFGLNIKQIASVTPSIPEEKARPLGATPGRKSVKNPSSRLDMMPSRLSLMNARDQTSTQAGSI